MGTTTAALRGLEFWVGMPTMHDDWNACQQEAPRSSQLPTEPDAGLSGQVPGVDWTPPAERNTAQRTRLLLLLLMLSWAWCWPALSRGQETPAEPDLGAEAPIGEAQPVTQPPDANAEVNPEPGGTAAAERDYLIPTDPVGLFLAGGFLMWPILLSSIISLWFVFERLIVLRRPRVIPRAFVDRFIQHLEQGKLNAETALRLCEENRSPIADVFAHGIRKWGKTSVEVEQAIIDGGERQVSQLRTHLRIINGVATVAPLLGLHGTVIGMIMSFNELAQGGEADRAERLAGGIGVALITTAAGLFVAIPSLILYMYLSGRVDRLVMDMDALSQKVVNLISAEAIAGRSRSGVAKASSPTLPSSVGVSAPKAKAVGT